MTEPFTFHDLLQSSVRHGTSFVFDGRSVAFACSLCDARFPQSDDGHRQLREHEFTHGQPTICDLSLLNGKLLRIAVVTAKNRDYGLRYTDVWGIDDTEGVLYHLGGDAIYGDDNPGKRGWKWKLTNGHGDTPNGREQLLLGSKSSAAK